MLHFKVYTTYHDRMCYTAYCMIKIMVIKKNCKNDCSQSQHFINVMNTSVSSQT